MATKTLAELQGELGYTLKDMQARLREHGSLEAAAASLELKPGTFRRYFGALANAAGRKSRTPEDYLLGKETQRGGLRREPGPPTRSWSARLTEETAAVLERALERARATGATTADGAVRALAETYLGLADAPDRAA